MKINVENIPPMYHEYVVFLKKYCLSHKISFEEANKHLLCIEAAKEQGVKDTQDPLLLEVLKKLKCDDVREVIEDAYDKTFPRCYGKFCGYCNEVIYNNTLCLERNIDGTTRRD